MEISFKEILKEFLVLTNLNPSGFAQRTKTDKQSVYNWLNDNPIKASKPTKHTLERLLKSDTEFKKYYQQRLGLNEIENTENKSERQTQYTPNLLNIISELEEEIYLMNRELKKKTELLNILQMVKEGKKKRLDD